ncbi:MAG: tetratricopeptide repeat protein, partial [Candidatus Latescibacterota bacterium]|nr:tetratricopeptide repeat protein [Candidatus Latescibacterota bacterium]
MSRRHPPHHHPCPLRGVLTPALLCGVILLGEPVLAQTVGDPVASRSAKAREHYDEGRYEEALRAYRDALVERPGSEPLHLNVGDALYELGDYEAAAGEFEQVTLAEDDGLAAEGYFNLGNSRYQLQD